MRRALLLLWLWALPVAAEPAEGEVDPVALAALLLQDGHPDRARRVLQDADREAEGFDLARYHTLRGLAAFKLDDHAGALAAFTAAAEAGNADPTVQIYRAQAAYQLRQCAPVIGALEAAGEAARAHAELFLMKADCHWTLEQHAPAFAALAAGEARHGPQRAFAQARVRWYLALDLSRAAIEAGRAYLASGEGGLDDTLFLGEALLRGKQHAAARDLLEGARLRHGDDERLLVQLGHAWLGAGHPLTAARFFGRAAAFAPKYARDAAEIYREHGRHAEALRQNAKVLDQQAKLRQRLAILLDMGRFEAVTALAPRLSRLGVLQADEDLRFALAFAWFQLGRYAEAERHLRRLTRADLFERAGTLRRAMAECRQAPERCR